MNKRKIATGLLAVTLMSLFAGCGAKTSPDTERISETAVFSWEDKYLEQEAEAAYGYVCGKIDIRAVYQEIPRETETELVVDFLQRREAAGHLVYRLAGAPKWGVEKDAGSMKAIIEETAGWNKSAGKRGGFAGIVWDVEPYLLDEWDEEPGRVMEQYVDNCAAVYKEANKKGLSVIVCIPYFYDNKGFEQELERLIEKGSDAVAVMNYNKNDEAGQIETEVRLAKKHRKGIIHITELQKPGYHDLTENNTYYYDGTEAVKESWENLQDTFGSPKLGFAWHYLEPALEILEREEEE